MSCKLIRKSRYILPFVIILFSCVSELCAQKEERWKLSVNNDQKPLEILMEMGMEDMGVTYLFDITRDTLNLAFVAEESIDWDSHGVGVFAMPKNREVLKIKLDNADMENVQVVFYKMWKAMPKNFKNVTTVFELHEYGRTKTGNDINSFIIRFKMKRPRRSNSMEL
ncbi:hypothetical protein [Labilibaculum euxinus]|uniref:Uncharacterized protein n=1 Tax=Labilibaculum euxinus TaxID=2686357 RepID=A0A7M4D5A5_9BACT|nr:hypothetical protein [Labilibaculum euxinus]MUP37834.1 hypothetical protein [Labilibaculum euxinus]MVB07039.1 hypothetical protein [Labilibaculum euxinus]